MAQGYRVIFAPNAKVLHAVGGIFRESNIQPIYFFRRNLLVTLIKNLELGNLLKILPVHILLLLVASLVTDLKSRRACRLLTVVQCLGYAVINFRRIWFKRLTVQSTRKVSDGELFKHIMAGMSLAERLREKVLGLGY